MVIKGKKIKIAISTLLYTALTELNSIRAIESLLCHCRMAIPLLVGN